MAQKGMPLFGTCAGMIMMAKNVMGNHSETLSLMDITVKRNAFGRQVDSFEMDLNIPVLGKKVFHTIFIRAPLIADYNQSVRILARLENGNIVAARENKMLAAAFHPELTEDSRLHQFFLKMTGPK